MPSTAIYNISHIIYDNTIYQKATI